MLKIITSVIAAAPILLNAPAPAAACKGVMRTNTQGQQQCVNGKRTFPDCVSGGMQLGYSKASAERYCQSRFSR